MSESGTFRTSQLELMMSVHGVSRKHRWGIEMDDRTVRVALEHCQCQLRVS